MNCVATVNEPLPASHNVYVVDDNRDVRMSIGFMLQAANMRVRPFGCGEDFLNALHELEPGCILLDVRMPQKDGLQVMAELQEREVDWPVIIMTGHGEIPIAVQAMKLGASDFIEKPFSEDALLSCFNDAFDLLEKRQAAAVRRGAARERIKMLTAREAEVLQGLLDGHSNKSLAQSLGISLRTVEMHRANMMDRLEAGSLAKALTLAIEAGFRPAAADVPRGR